MLPSLEGVGLVDSPPTDTARETVQQIVEAAGDRISVAGDILDFRDFFLSAEELPYDEAAFEKRIRQAPEAVEFLGQLRSELADSRALRRVQRWKGFSRNSSIARESRPLRSFTHCEWLSPEKRSVSACSKRWRSLVENAPWNESIGRWDRTSSRLLPNEIRSSPYAQSWYNVAF